MWSNFKKIEKVATITLGLLALIGITAYFSGGVNGQKISSISFTLIFAIIGIGAMITMIKTRMRYRNYNTSQNYQQYQNKKEDKQKTQNDDSFEYEEKIWASKGKDGRKRLCWSLHIPQEYANKSLRDLPLGYRSLLIDRLQEATNTGRYSEENKRSEREKYEQSQREKERSQRENEDRNRQKEKSHEQKENYSEQNNSNSEILGYYHVLNLKPGASKQQIKEAYRELSKMVHPDKNQGSKFSNEFQKKINDAYEGLMNQNP